MIPERMAVRQEPVREVTPRRLPYRIPTMTADEARAWYLEPRTGWWGRLRTWLKFRRLNRAEGFEGLYDHGMREAKDASVPMRKLPAELRKDILLATKE